MANSIYQKLALATAGAALSLAAMEANPANAAIITYDFTAKVTGGSLAGNSYNGFFRYDDTAFSFPSRVGKPYFSVTEFNFEFAGTTFTQRDLRFDCRILEICGTSLFIPGGEFITTSEGAPIGQIPRGGTPSLIFFQNVGFMGFFPITERPLFSFFGGLNGGFFAYQLPGEMPTINSGSVTYLLRTTPTPPPISVPEPSTVFGLSMLGFGWLLRKKKASCQNA
jgi:PEP-CTERM motif